MKKRIKYLFIILLLALLVCVTANSVLKAKEKKEKELVLEKDKVDKKEVYSIKRVNNKYTVKSEKLKGKKLEKVFYDDMNVYLYYEGELATLLKYNVENKKVVILYEDSEEIHGGFTKIGSYYKLGNLIFDRSFKKIKDYPEIQAKEVIYPNLEKTLFETETGITEKTLKTGEEKEVLTNNENFTYHIYNIKSDGNYLLLERTYKEKKELIVADKDYKIVNIFEQAEEKEIEKVYTLLDGVPYLLEERKKEDKLGYRIYDAKTKEVVYKSEDDYHNYLFDNTKFVCNDKDGNVKLVDYVTKEEKILLPKEKKEEIVQEFILSSDSYSLVLHPRENDFTFYIFYL